MKLVFSPESYAEGRSKWFSLMLGSRSRADIFRTESNERAIRILAKAENLDLRIIFTFSEASGVGIAANFLRQSQRQRERPSRARLVRQSPARRFKQHHGRLFARTKRENFATFHCARRHRVSLQDEYK